MKPRRSRHNHKELEPDEIFLDATNLPSFEQGRLEGKLERPLAHKTFWYSGAFLILLFSALWLEDVRLQIVNGKAFSARADENRLQVRPLWPSRGRIFDRAGHILADNKSAFIEPFYSRSYTFSESLAHLLGYLGYPSEDTEHKEILGEWQTLIGKTGVEEKYEEALAGSIGMKLAEVNSKGEISSESIEELPKNGQDIYLTIDAPLQERVYESVKEVVQTRGFKGGAAVILDPFEGEVLSLVSYPAFNPEILSEGEPRAEIEKMLSSESKPLFNRAISGLYPAGSVIKPLMALAALEEGVIDPSRQIFSPGYLSLPNPFFPDKPSIFYDWKAHGWTDMRQALAVSSDVYFYTIGGGFGDVPGLGVKKIQEWAKKFGLGEKTGLDLPSEKNGFVPGPEWKAEADKADPLWRIGDTFHLSIGQGNLQVTPLQMAVMAAAIANGGKILEPHLVRSIKEGDKTIFENTAKIRKVVELKPENLRVVREGMELATQIGTARALSGLGINIAGKTGTAEIGSEKKRVNSWFIGFFPADNPKIAMAVVLETGSAQNLVGAPAASRQIVEWLKIYRPELTQP
ncbi:MAG: penicillin-binding transpeptidase domain-containing protein [bacterium]|nr:penicillin-binding transpeptidase domain-containing protein [bacterium]